MSRPSVAAATPCAAIANPRRLRLPALARLVRSFPRVIVADLARAVERLPAKPRRLTVTIRMESLAGGQAVVSLVPHTLPGGGYRYSVRCPSCAARRRHLYLVGAVLTCRACAGLVYPSWACPASWRLPAGARSRAVSP